MSELNTLPNIGRILSERLLEAGISTPEELRAMGAKEAYIRVCGVYPDACINHLYAIEGAIQNIRWHSLSDETKQALKEFHRSFSDG
jgi:DNA transformation protein